jgi:hypothetical protein
VHIAWDDSNKYLSFIIGREWDKEDFKFIEFRKTPLGWDFNIHRLMVSYDNHRKVKPRGYY